MAKEKDMYPPTRLVLRNRYPASDNWSITEQENHGTYIPDFVVQKNGTKYFYKIPVEVKFECKATQAHIDQVNKYASKLAGPNVVIHEKILVYPSGADTSLVPSDIKVIKLTQFKCD